MQWQPIETAPKDGTPFWGRVGDDAIRMLWHAKFKAFVSSWREMTIAPGYTMSNGEKSMTHHPTIHHPTHWMMMPPEPDAM